MLIHNITVYVYVYIYIYMHICIYVHIDIHDIYPLRCFPKRRYMFLRMTTFDRRDLTGREPEILAMDPMENDH